MPHHEVSSQSAGSLMKVVELLLVGLTCACLLSAGCRGEEGGDGDADADVDGDGDGDIGSDGDVEPDGDVAPDGDLDTAMDGDVEPPPGCEPGSRDGPDGFVDGEIAGGGIRYNLRTPPDYDPLVAHPLIVVYAPAGGDEEVTEAFTRLTPFATDAGFIIAYSDHRSPRSVEVIDDLGEVVTDVTERWCIDATRVYLTGHSDGGSVASVLAILELTTPGIAAIAPSAAGINDDFLSSVTCTDPMPVMVIHSSRDSLFPGFGAQAAAWWVECNGCDPDPLEPRDDGCLPYGDCMDDVEVLYCEGTGAHGAWPTLNSSIIDFFQRF